MFSFVIDALVQIESTTLSLVFYINDRLLKKIKEQEKTIVLTARSKLNIIRNIYKELINNQICDEESATIIDEVY